MSGAGGKLLQRSVRLEDRKVARDDGLLAGNHGRGGPARLINGGLMRKQGPVVATTNTIGVESVDAAVTAVENAGGKLIMGKTAIPTVGYFAYLEDPEKNTFGVMQADQNAK
jgi:predicted enzyme related to lactoylglutathione lyase